MRTLKKVLALSLVFAMAFTMMAGAAFKDQDKIDSSLTNDIQLLTALGVFQGDENGNFNPTDNVKRSEAAKMIYVLKNNGVDDGAVAFQGVSNYSDVPVGHWAEGYINYCTNLGYMGGWQENGVQKFDPNGNVTGVELMKMLLCMIGYKADVQGYTGAGWQTNVLVDAATSGLSVEFTPSVYGATPRQWTARLMTNAINANWISYSRGEVVIAETTYGNQYLKLYSMTGTLTGTLTNALANKAANTVLTDNKYSTITNTKLNDDDSVSQKPVDFDFDAPNSLLGQEVRVYFRGNSLTESTLDTDTKVYGVVASGNEKIVETTIDGLSFDDDFDASTTADGGANWTEGTGGKVTVEGLGTKTYGADEKIQLYVNYNHKGEYTMATLKAIGWLGGNSTLPVKLIADSKGMIKSVMITGVPVYGVVSKLDADNGIFELKDANDSVIQLVDLNDKAITFNKANSENFAEYLNVASDVEVGDVVLCLGTVDGEAKWNVTKLESIGAASGYTVKDGKYNTIKINGTDYKKAHDAIVMNGYDWNVGTDGAGTHSYFYTDGKYVVYSKPSEDAVSANNLAYLIAGGVTYDAFKTPTLKAKVLLADGTEASYTLNKNAGLGELVVDANYDFTKVNLDNDDGTTPVEDATDKVYTYSISDNVITLKTITTEAALDGNNATYLSTGNDKIAYDKSSGVVSVGNDEYRTNDSTYFFVKSGTVGDYDYAVVKASELNGDVEVADNSATNSVFVAQKVSNFKTILAGVMTLADMPAAEAEDYYFVTGRANYVGQVDGKYVVELPVKSAGETEVLTFKYDDDADINTDMGTLNGNLGKIVNAELKADGSVDMTAPSTTLGLTVVSATGGDGKWAVGALTAWDDTNAYISNKLLKINSDVKVYNVEISGSDPATLVEDSSIIYSEDGTKTNAAYLTNSDGEITAIFIEVNGADISSVATAD